MKFTYRPTGVCARLMEFDINDDGIITDVSIIGGCNGNLQGISSLVKGLAVDEVIRKLKGIRCGGKPTSCPDQISIALEQFSATRP